MNVAEARALARESKAAPLREAVKLIEALIATTASRGGGRVEVHAAKMFPDLDFDQISAVVEHFVRAGFTLRRRQAKNRTEILEVEW